MNQEKQLPTIKGKFMRADTKTRPGRTYPKGVLGSAMHEYLSKMRTKHAKEIADEMAKRWCEEMK